MNSQVKIIRPDGTDVELPGKITCEIHAGEQFVTRTPGGGGWGEPTSRSRETVARDVKERLISAARAREIYGYEDSLA